jgi:hypothetical protein
MSNMMRAPHACLIHYASALIDPVNTPAGACVPYGFPLPSQRVKVFLRGTMNLGTTGQGFVVYSPDTANNYQCGSVTTSASVGTNSTLLNAFTNLGPLSLTQLPYSQAQLNKFIQSRIVAAGLRIRYAGTETNRNGYVTMIEDPNHQDLASQSYNQFESQINAQNERPQPDGSWHEVNFSGPVKNSEVEFESWTNQSVNNYMVAYVNGNPGDLYEVEIYEHAEYAGDAISGAVTTHIDPQGYGHVVEATKAASMSQPLSTSTGVEAFKTFASLAGSSIKSVINLDPTVVTSVLSPVLKAMLKSASPSMNLLL